MFHRRGFTLIELLVVVAIIVLLLAILLPSLNRAVAVAQDAVCRAQVRGIAQGTLSFTTDHFGVLPGCYTGNYVGAEPWQKSWLGNEVWAGVSHEGTLLKYIGGESIVVDKDFYRCPSLPDGVLRSGVGSNGMFDYSMLQVFTGAKTSNMPTTCTINIPDSSNSVHSSVPIFIEEDPAFHINNTNIEPGFSNVDRAGSWHSDISGNYAALDGSVHHIQWTTRGANTFEMTAVAPSGANVNFNGVGNYYASWNGR